MLTARVLADWLRTCSSIRPHGVHRWKALLTRWTQINWRMRIILNDGRQMTGQMLAFDKVCLPSKFPLRTRLTSLAAHEPRSRRHRRVPPREAQTGQVWCSRLRRAGHRERREANPRPHHRPRRPDHFRLRRVSSPRRSQRPSRTFHRGWHSLDPRCWPRRRSARRPWCSSRQLGCENPPYCHTFPPLQTPRIWG